MKKWVKLSAGVGIAALFAIGCGEPKAQSASEEFGRQASTKKQAPMMTLASGNTPSSGGGSGLGGGTVIGGSPGPSLSAPTSASESPEQSAKLTLASMTESQADKYLIKNAVISIEAPDVRKAAETATGYAKSANGYVSGLHESQDNLGLRNISLELRVPAPEFDGSMGRIEAIGRVIDNQVTTEDVTEKYVDTDAQLHNLKMTEARLLAHLNQTGKLSDILTIETEVSGVRSNIDELEGKMRYMSHRISFSTISLTFKEPAHIEPIAPTESFSPGQIASQAMRSVSGFIQSGISTVIWLLIWSVVWAPLVTAASYIYLRQRRRIGAR